MIQVDILQIQKCTAGYCTHTYTHTHTHARTHERTNARTNARTQARAHTGGAAAGGGGGIKYIQIWRDEFLRLAWKKMLILSDKHHMVTSFNKFLCPSLTITTARNFTTCTLWSCPCTLKEEKRMFQKYFETPWPVGTAPLSVQSCALASCTILE